MEDRFVYDTMLAGAGSDVRVLGCQTLVLHDHVVQGTLPTSVTQQARFALLAPATRLFDGFSEAIRLTRTRVVAAPNVTHLRYRVGR